MRRLVVLAAALGILACSAAVRAEVNQRGGLRVTFEGKLSPSTLPRHGSAPVGVSVGGTVSSTNGKIPPQLRKIEIAINRHGRLEPRGLPICSIDDIQPATTESALESCRTSLVGTGHFSAKILLPSQAPFPSSGKIFAFNGRFHGRPAILAHVYGTEPAPTSFTLPFAISKRSGTFGTALSASLPKVTSNWGYVTGLQMTLRRRFAFHGQLRSYASAGCPAPDGFPGAVFPFARATFGFSMGRTLSTTLIRSCRARG
jgi:hypothetical protein